MRNIADYHGGFVDKGAIILLLRVLNDTKTIDKNALQQWLNSPKVSSARTENTTKLLLKVKIIEELRHNRYAMADSFKKNVKKYGIKAACQQSILLSMNQGELHSFVKNAKIQDDGKLFWRTELVPPSMTSLRNLLISFELLKVKNGFMESSQAFSHHLCEQGLIPSTLLSSDSKSGRTSLEELLVQLERKNKLGEEAEVRAMEYEKKRLANKNLQPKRVSLTDVSAGYDLLSFMGSDSKFADRYIEVKSCSDASFQFYISENELRVSSSKGDSYFLYLYNRKSKKFKIIQNPYLAITANDEWVSQPQIFQIRLRYPSN